MTELIDFPQVYPHPENVGPDQDDNIELAFQGIVRALDQGTTSTEIVEEIAMGVEGGRAAPEGLADDIEEINDGEPDPEPKPKPKPKPEPKPEPDYPHKTTIGGDWVHSSRPLS